MPGALPLDGVDMSCHWVGPFWWVCGRLAAGLLAGRARVE